jgi:hypothetical protein
VLPRLRVHRRAGLLAQLLVGHHRSWNPGVLYLREQECAMTPATRALYDQLLATLQDCHQPMTTGEVACAAPALVEVYDGCVQSWHVRRRSARTRQETCCGDHHVHVRARFAREVYHALRAMAAAGEIVKIPAQDSSAVSWRAVDRPRFVDELEACLAMQGPDRDRPGSAD